MSEGWKEREEAVIATQHRGGKVRKEYSVQSSLPFKTNSSKCSATQLFGQV
jgi:hypothetical protein